MKARDQHSTFPVNIERFTAGYNTNRSPLQAPIRITGLSAVPLYDAMIDGLNVEISPRNTVVRRPGLPQYCSVAVTGTPLGFSQFKRIGNSPYLLLDTTTGIYQFTTSAITSIFAKTTSAQSSFQQAGTTLYTCDGVDAKKFDSSLAATNWGIAAPTVAPSVANISAAGQPAWAASTYYNPSLLIDDTNGNLQLLTTAGTTNGTQPVWATVAGNTTTDGTAVWTCKGQAARQTSHVYAANSYIEVDYSKSQIVWVWNPAEGQYEPHATTVNYSDFFNTANGGTSSATATGSISWAPGIGSKVTDGSVTWANAGTKITWSSIGASTLVSTNAYIVDSNGNQQTANKAGKSSSSAPTWSTVLNAVTSDGTTSWTNNGSVSAANPLPWQYVFVYKNSTTAHISSTSPASNAIFLAVASNIALSGLGSGDSQVDKIEIYRISQGGSTYYFLDTVTNPGAGISWSYVDSSPDSILNTQQIVTTVPLNNPPPSGASLVAFYQGRLWVASGNNLYFDGGGDIINGVAHECFPPANVFPYLSTITALVPTSQGLVVFLSDEIHAILGGPQTLTYYDQTLFQGVGTKSQNNVTQDQDEIYFISSQGQGLNLSPSDFGEFGFSIADVLQSTFNPSTSYLAAHRSGPDVGIFVSDDSTNLIRFNQTSSIWSLPARPVGGCGPIASLETSTAVYSLLTVIGGKICSRSLTNFTDASGSTYSAFGTFGSIEVASMASPTANIRNVAIRNTAAGSLPSVGILQNATTGTFSAVPYSNSIPARLDGNNSGQNIRQSQYDLSKASPTLSYNQFNHVQLKVSWPAENALNELIAFSLYEN
jgi:hypothetical protein